MGKASSHDCRNPCVARWRRYNQILYLLASATAYAYRSWFDLPLSSFVTTLTSNMRTIASSDRYDILRWCLVVCVLTLANRSKALSIHSGTRRRSWSCIQLCRPSSSVSSAIKSRRKVAAEQQCKTRQCSSSTTLLKNIYDDWRSDAIVEPMYLCDDNVMQCLEEFIESDYGKQMFGWVVMNIYHYMVRVNVREFFTWIGCSCY